MLACDMALLSDCFPFLLYRTGISTAKLTTQLSVNTDVCCGNNPAKVLEDEGCQFPICVSRSLSRKTRLVCVPQASVALHVIYDVFCACSRLHPDGAEALMAGGSLMPPEICLSGKMEVLDRMLVKLLAAGHKVTNCSPPPALLSYPPLLDRGDCLASMCKITLLQEA